LDEAEEIAYQQVKQHSLREFYRDTALPMLALAARQQARGATAVQYQFLIEGTASIVRELQSDQSPAGAADTGAQETSAQPGSTLCIGLRNELDALSAQMLAHALSSAGHPARAFPVEGWGIALAKDLEAALSVRRIHLCTLKTTPQTQARIMTRRLRRHWPSAEIVLVAWCAAESLTSAENLTAMGVDVVAFQLDAVVEYSGRAQTGDPAIGLAQELR
jgi:hypothetical protein